MVERLVQSRAKNASQTGMHACTEGYERDTPNKGLERRQLHISTTLLNVEHISTTLLNVELTEAD